MSAAAGACHLTSKPSRSVVNAFPTSFVRARPGLEFNKINSLYCTGKDFLFRFVFLLQVHGSKIYISTTRADVVPALICTNSSTASHNVSVTMVEKRANDALE